MYSCASRRRQQRREQLPSGFTAEAVSLAAAGAAFRRAPCQAPAAPEILQRGSGQEPTSIHSVSWTPFLRCARPRARGQRRQLSSAALRPLFSFQGQGGLAPFPARPPCTPPFPIHPPLQPLLLAPQVHYRCRGPDPGPRRLARRLLHPRQAHAHLHPLHGHGLLRWGPASP
jgi:hypothetical protein